MAIRKQILLLCGIFALCCSISVRGANHISSKDDNFKELSLWERIRLFTASKVSPKTFEHVPLDELFVGRDNPYVDALFVDLRSLLIQAWNINEEQNLFELDWDRLFQFCYMECYYIRFAETSKDTHMFGLKDTVHETSITPTTLRTSYYVPHFQYSSPNYLWNITVSYNSWDFPGLSTMFQDLSFTMEEVNTTFTFDYYHVPELGFQVDKLEIDFRVGKMEALIRNWTAVEQATGEMQDMGSVFFDYAEYIESDWLEYYKDDYMPHLKDSINCVLSGGRVDPVGCANQTNNYYDSVLYYKLNVVQLFETFGAAQFNRPDVPPSN